MAGNLLGYVMGNTTLFLVCRWKLPSITIFPGYPYVARLEGGSVEVSIDGRG
jgi:hypothetical protein